MLIAEYPKGHSLVLSSSMANDTHIPGLIRGHEGTIMMVPDGKFEGQSGLHHGHAAGRRQAGLQGEARAPSR